MIAVLLFLAPRVPDAWILLVFSIRLLSIESTLGAARYDEALSYRVDLVMACAEATADRSERYLCVQIPRFESSYRPDVGRCDVKGKEGEITAWQIIPRNAAERARLCVSLVEDAKFALERIRESRAACRHLPKQDQLALYARGSCASEEGRDLSRHRFPNDALVKRVETEEWGSSPP